ncbi:MAG: heme-binding protein [Chloroflexi bacterium]|nr:heme-binding protein [Chloroflexota bacterium]
MPNLLQQKPCLTLEVAKAIATAAEAEARTNAWSVSIALVDDAGRLLYFARMNDTANSSVEVAIAKAVHSANYRRPTKFHQDLILGGTLPVLGLREILPVEGGIPLMIDGRAVGAIGVSGVQSPQDAQIAAVGVAAFERWLAE